MQVTAYWIARHIVRVRYIFDTSECSACGYMLKRHQKPEDVDTCPKCGAHMVKEDKKK